MRSAADCGGDGNASGMPDPVVCVSDRYFACLSGMLAGEKVKGEWRRENGFVKLRFTHLYPNGFTALWAMYHCSASDSQKEKTDS